MRGDVAEYVPVPVDHYYSSYNVTKMDAETWAGFYLNVVFLSDAINSGKVKLTGDKDEITQIFDMFDKLKLPCSKLQRIFPVRYGSILMSLANPAASCGECARMLVQGVKGPRVRYGVFHLTPWPLGPFCSAFLQ